MERSVDRGFVRIALPFQTACATNGLGEAVIAPRRGFNRAKGGPADITARLVQRMNLLLLMLHGVADVLRTILFIPDLFRRQLRRAVRNAAICSPSNSNQRAQVIRKAITRQRA